MLQPTNHVEHNSQRGKDMQKYAKIVIDFRAAKPLMVNYYCAGDVMFEIWWVIILHRESDS